LGLIKKIEKMNYDIVPLFSTPVYNAIEDYRPSKEELDRINSFDSDRNFLKHGVQAFISDNRYILNDPLLHNIKLLCEKHLNEYCQNVLLLKQKFYITNSWVSIKRPGQGHHFHKHPNSIISGVYYVSVFDDFLNFVGDPGFSKDFNFAYSLKGHNIYNSKGWGIPVTTGSIILFPSCTFHGVDENKSFEDRIVIGFNSFVTGSFGENDYCSDLNIQ